jgi:hypothetical protein
MMFQRKTEEVDGNLECLQLDIADIFHVVPSLYDLAARLN